MNQITIDPFSPASLFVELLRGGDVLSSATGFLYQHDGATYIVTNWHVLSGRDPQSGQPLHGYGAVPDSVRIHHHGPKLGSFVASDHRLYGGDDVSLWRMHPRGQQIDIGILRIDVRSDLLLFPVNTLPQRPDMMLGIGMDVFVLGFPFGLNGGRFPVWKRASIASEIEMPLSGLPCFLIDTATRPGMSGSPVFVRSWSQYTGTDGAVHMPGELHHTRFIGVYSGRVTGQEASDAQLGIVWNEAATLDAIANGIEGDYAIHGGT